MYHGLILLDNSSSFDLRAYQAKIAAFHAKFDDNISVIMQQENSLTVYYDGFRFQVYFTCSPHVAAESKEITEQFAADHPEKAAITASKCRVEISSAFDADMLYFNDYLHLIEILPKMSKAYVFEPASGKFI